MNEELIVGLVALGLPLLGGGYFALRNSNANVFRMFVAMVLVGLGYLTVTGALNDIGATVLGKGAAPVAVPVAAPVAAPAAPAPATPAPAKP